MASLREGYVEGLDMALPLDNFFGFVISIIITVFFWISTKQVWEK